jgi:hypothetical protein
VSEPNNFLTRWSRRKRDVEAAEGKEKTLAAEDAAARTEQEDARLPAAEADAQSAEPEFDLSSLPSIDEITATTNVSGFFNPAVPEALRREALRRLWSLNPPTPEALLMAEYAGDFTDAGNMAGFGPLQMTDELRQMARQIVGGSSNAPQESAPEPAPATGREDVIEGRPIAASVPARQTAGEEISSRVGSPAGVFSVVEREAKVIERVSTTNDNSPQCENSSGATQQKADSPEDEQSSNRPSVPHGRGRALPR